MTRHELWELKQMQSLPLQAKIQMTRYRIRQWVDEFGEDGVYVSFSGGKDSTFLLDIVRKDYPNIEAVFVNTGLEYPSVRLFAESKENVIVLRPTMNFRDVICKYGYPVISKTVSHNVSVARRNPNGNVMKNIFNPNKTGPYAMHKWEYLINAPFFVSEKCCDEMKKNPAKQMQKISNKRPILATMAHESKMRETSWLHNGCNAFDIKSPASRPMSFWTENDVLQYIYENKLEIASQYGTVFIKPDFPDELDGQMQIEDFLGLSSDSDYVFSNTGCKRTGCILCMFGITQDKDRFIRLAEQEPKLCDYVMRGGEFGENGMWQPSKSGLGYWFVIEWLNVHGNLKIGMPDREKYLSEYQTGETEKYLEVENTNV